ncbi:hypothetical protein DL769_007215 [Monosporascus sp. CRB-8-3]|nr:hypothetical protein DL769_007215 [Monosporascus sp. CRB-8-3]
MAEEKPLALAAEKLAAEKPPTPAAGRDKLEAQIKAADMTEDMQQEAIDVAQEAMGKFTIEKDIAQHIKRTFDERKGPTWHCIVGRNFGSFVTHETKHFIYFYLGHCAILLFKTQAVMRPVPRGLLKNSPLHKSILRRRSGSVDTTFGLDQTWGRIKEIPIPRRKYTYIVMGPEAILYLSYHIQKQRELEYVS